MVDRESQGSAVRWVGCRGAGGSFFFLYQIRTQAKYTIVLANNQPKTLGYDKRCNPNR